MWQDNHDCTRCQIDSSFEALIDLFNHEYWGRLWIIQEISASTDVRIICGEEMLSLRDLDTALQQCRLSLYWKDSNQVACKFFDIVMHLRRAYQSYAEL